MAFPMELEPREMNAIVSYGLVSLWVVNFSKEDFMHEM